MRSASLMALMALVAVSAGFAAAEHPVYGFDLGGRPVHSLASGSDRAVVLFFIATDCPISNRYAPEIRRLEGEFTGKDVAFWLVYPNATETAEGVLRHQKDYGLGGATLVHPSQALQGATVTPEAAVMLWESATGSAFRRVYLGRIDDWYVDIGRQRPRAARHDLEAAITAALAHRAVAPPGGPPIGCGVISEAALRKR